MAARILVVDSDRALLELTQTILQFLEFETIGLCSPQECEQRVNQEPACHAVVLGPCGGNRPLSEVLRKLKALDPYLPLILFRPGNADEKLTPEMEQAVLATVDLPLRYGGLSRALSRLQTYRENRHQEGATRSLELFRSLVGSSVAIQRVRKLIEMVAGSDTNVLVAGESGTGKEVVARHIHYHSGRRSKPFVPVNCGAIPPELLESELFGHEKGAFTGAIATRQGRFEMADSGTLFLDEIGDMSLSMQVKLLRVLQERTFERVGSNRSITVDVRIVAATHVDLERAINEGRFREDLFYRLNVFPIETPPLRERAEDLPLLVNDLVERLQHEGRGAIRLTAVAMESLRRYRWPGNVRELANLVERLSILYPNGVIDVQDLPEKYRAQELLDAEPEVERGAEPEPLAAEPYALSRLPRAGLDLKEHLTGLELSLIRQALDESNWVVAHAAKRLRMGRTTLVEKMRKYGLARDEDGALP